MKHFTLPIGLRFVDGGNVYEVVKDKVSGCENCAFCGPKCVWGWRPCSISRPDLACGMGIRDDKCSVSFKHVGYFIPKNPGSL